MSPRKKASGHTILRVSRKKSSPSGFYTPFHNLKQRLMHTDREKPPSRAVKHDASVIVVNTLTLDDESGLFQQAMADIVPLDRTRRGRVPIRKPVPTRSKVALSDDDEVRSHLLELIQGSADFEISCSDEYIDGAAVGISPGVVAKLRRGEFSCQAHADLHGYDRVQARQVVLDFLRGSFARNQRCVLIISGRGHNSANRQPVLKEHLVAWLTRSPLNRLVLAFATARSCDGGTGAFYVLLRRSPAKAPLVSPSGW